MFRYYFGVCFGVPYCRKAPNPPGREVGQGAASRGKPLPAMVHNGVPTFYGVPTRFLRSSYHPIAKGSAPQRWGATSAEERSIPIIPH